MTAPSSPDPWSIAGTFPATRTSPPPSTAPPTPPPPAIRHRRCRLSTRPPATTPRHPRPCGVSARRRSWRCPGPAPRRAARSRVHRLATHAGGGAGGVGLLGRADLLAEPVVEGVEGAVVP